MSDTEQKPRGTNSVACSVDGCSKPTKAFGLCGTHYQRKRRTGDADTVRKPGPKPRPGRDLMSRSMIDLFVLGTASARSESRWRRTVRIAGYLDALAYEQYGCTAEGFERRITGNRTGHLPNFGPELEYAEVLLDVADNEPDMWLRIVNEVCDAMRAWWTSGGYEPRCTGNHTRGWGRVS